MRSLAQILDKAGGYLQAGGVALGMFVHCVRIVCKFGKSHHYENPPKPPTTYVQKGKAERGT